MTKPINSKLITHGGQSAFCEWDKSADESEKLAVEITNKAVCHMLNIMDLCDLLTQLLINAGVADTSEYYRGQIIRDIEALNSQLDTLLDVEEHIFWLETDGGTYGGALDYTREIRLCTIPKNLNQCLHDDFFGKGIPIILTSGTISANGDFSHIKRQLGLDKISSFRISETVKQSPFDYYNNSLLYISEDMPFPNNKDRDYIFTLANEIEELL